MTRDKILDGAARVLGAEAFARLAASVAGRGWDSLAKTRQNIMLHSDVTVKH
jgi:hypothetical protein